MNQIHYSDLVSNPPPPKSRWKQWRQRLKHTDPARYRELLDRRNARERRVRATREKIEVKILIASDELSELRERAQSMSVSVPELIRTYITWGQEQEGL
jgi:hypothetical protein